MWSAVVPGAAFVLGATVGKRPAAAVGRAVVKTFVKTGVVAGRTVQSATSGIREEVSDIVAEAKAETSGGAGATGKRTAAKAK